MPQAANRNREGPVVCWDLNASTTDVRLSLPELQTQTDVCVGGDFVCTLTDNGVVNCFTSDDLAQPVRVPHSCDRCFQG
jgi:hypothetical protein